VYKLRKVLYGLKQTPMAWYGRLRWFLFSKGFEMGKVDKTLFSSDRAMISFFRCTWMILSLAARLTLWLRGF
jgi:hypothetical protein